VNDNTKKVYTVGTKEIEKILIEPMAMKASQVDDLLKNIIGAILNDSCDEGVPSRTRSNLESLVNALDGVLDLHKLTVSDPLFSMFDDGIEEMMKGKAS